jgi:shikimate dehydrogenase
MRITGTTRVACVIGDPVEHSRSPGMHNAASAALGLDRVYVALRVEAAALAHAIHGLAALGCDGANVTVPHKTAALALCDELGAEADDAGAVNTLSFGPGGRLRGDLTDGLGLVAALPRVPESAVVLGAGGSARAAVHALAGTGCEVLVLARTPSRAEGLPATVVDRPVAAQALVNCTPVGLHGPDELPLDPAGYELVVDFVYREGGTALTRRATGRVVDGLELLVRQGALSFARWTGRQASLEAMRAAVQIP